MIYVGSWPITSIGIFYEPLQNLCIPWLQPTASSIFLVFHFVIMAIIFITNVAILYLAKRHSTGRKSVQKATLTVSMVCWVFVGSYCPWLGYWGLLGAGKEVPDLLIVVGVLSLQINLVGNPFIYSFTNKRYLVAII